MLSAAKEQLAHARNEFLRVTHNIEAVINNVEKSIALVVVEQMQVETHD